MEIYFWASINYFMSQTLYILSVKFTALSYNVASQQIAPEYFR